MSGLAALMFDLKAINTSCKGQTREHGCNWPLILTGRTGMVRGKGSDEDTPAAWREESVHASTMVATERLHLTEKQKEAVQDLTSKATPLVKGQNGTGLMETLALDVLHCVKAGDKATVLPSGIDRNRGNRIKEMASALAGVCLRLGEKVPNIGYIKDGRYAKYQDANDWSFCDLHVEERNSFGHKPPGHDLNRRVRTMALTWAEDTSHPCHAAAIKVKNLRDRNFAEAIITPAMFERLQIEYDENMQICSTHRLLHGDNKLFKGPIRVVTASVDSIPHPWFVNSFKPTLVASAEAKSTAFGDVPRAITPYMECCSVAHFFGDPDHLEPVLASRHCNEFAGAVEGSMMTRYHHNVPLAKQIVLDEQYQPPQ